MTLYVQLQRHCGLSMSEVENTWDDMQFFAFLHCWIEQNAKEKREADRERDRQAWRKALGRKVR